MNASFKHFLDRLNPATTSGQMTRQPEQQRILDQMTRNLTLYQSPGCPFCVRVSWAIEQLALNITARNVYREPLARAELLAGGGRTTVPCLRIEEDSEIRWMYESTEIIRYLKALTKGANEQQPA
ncbi:MAG: glutathione S-transferase N-terminal domain-containing protein [Xanthomonadales bacterium]|nr:glutathione S-transferase N-terminal domain-containing protein [Xanthomonadales bacterium]